MLLAVAGGGAAGPVEDAGFGGAVDAQQGERGRARRAPPIALQLNRDFHALFVRRPFLCDLELVCEDGAVAAHRALIEVRCPTLLRVAQPIPPLDRAENAHSRSLLCPRGLARSVLELVLEFLYCDQLTRVLEDVSEIVALEIAAEQLVLPALAALARRSADEAITTANFAAALKLAHARARPALEEACLRFAAGNYKLIASDDEGLAGLAAALPPAALVAVLQAGAGRVRPALAGRAKIEDLPVPSLTESLRQLLHRGAGDVTLVSRDGRETRAHGFVLAARSEFFEGLLRARMADRERVELSQWAHSAVAMRALLAFLYTGELPALSDPGDCLALLEAHRFFVLRDAAMERECGSLLVDWLSPELLLPAVAEAATGAHPELMDRLLGAAQRRRLALPSTGPADAPLLRTIVEHLLRGPAAAGPR
jgi:hypothetical protein